MSPARQPSPPSGAARGRGRGRGREDDAGARARAVAAAVNRDLSAPALRVGPAPGRLEPAPSGFAALDEASGLGGFPRGRFSEIVGRATAGRETIAARTVAGGMAVGAAGAGSDSRSGGRSGGSAEGLSAWIDVSGALDVAWLAEQGVDLARLAILRPPRPLDALAIAARLAACGQLDVLVLDALTDLPAGGGTSEAIARFVRATTPRLARSSTALLVLSAPDRHSTPLAHAAALRVSLHRVGLLRRGGVFRGWRTRARILKSPGMQGGEPGLEVWL